jgi:hypothetical protein
MTNREKSARDMVRRTQHEFPQALRWLPVFFNTEQEHRAGVRGYTIHTLLGCAEDLDNFLADPSVANFDFAGVLIVSGQAEITIRIAPGPRQMIRRNVLRLGAKRHMASAEAGNN